MIFPLTPASHALFLDFDGTLSPIQADPDAVFLPSGGAQTLLELAERMDGALAIISGRDIRDLALRIPASLWRAGGHGADICPPGEMPPAEMPEAPQALINAAEELCGQFPGVRLERKGPVLALHYRIVPDFEGPLRRAVTTLLDGQGDYEIQEGKRVLEIRPAGVHKGVAVRALMKEAGFVGRAPVMIGDDTTDEDAMSACLELGGAAIRVGTGNSVAPYRLDDSTAVWNWLEGALV